MDNETLNNLWTVCYHMRYHIGIAVACLLLLNFVEVKG